MWLHCRHAGMKQDQGEEGSRLRRDDMQTIQDSCWNCRCLVLVQGEDSSVALAGVSVAYPGGLGQGQEGVGGSQLSDQCKTFDPNLRLQQLGWLCCKLGFVQCTLRWRCLNVKVPLYCGLHLQDPERPPYIHNHRGPLQSACNPRLP